MFYKLIKLLLLSLCLNCASSQSFAEYGRLNSGLSRNQVEEISQLVWRIYGVNPVDIDIVEGYKGRNIRLGYAEKIIKPFKEQILMGPGGLNQFYTYVIDDGMNIIINIGFSNCDDKLLYKDKVLKIITYKSLNWNHHRVQIGQEYLFPKIRKIICQDK